MMSFEYACMSVRFCHKHTFISLEAGKKEVKKKKTRKNIVAAAAMVVVAFLVAFILTD